MRSSGSHTAVDGSEADSARVPDAFARSVDGDDSAVLDRLRTHQSSGRVLLHRMVGATSAELRGRGCWVETSDGNRYLDLGSYSVFLLGHSPPRVIDAVRHQLDLLPQSSRVFPVSTNADAAAAIASIAPAGLSKVMLLNSGAEAVEAAIKMTRLVTGRSRLVHLSRSFHGKTVGALSLTDAPIFRAPFEPLLDDVVRVPRDDVTQACAEIMTGRVAAVFVEPVQGEGGVYEVEADFLRALRASCDATQTLLVFDEIQCGLGRSGAMWASAASGVRPDVLLVGKALGGGVMAVSAVVATHTAFRPFDLDPLLHTSTFGGNPLASAAACATVTALVVDDVPARAARLGVRMLAILGELVESAPEHLVGVSGRGLLLGLHCARPEVAGALLRTALRERVLLTPCLTSPRVLRVTPSVLLDDEECFDFARGALTRAVGALGQELL